jgi:PIN domain nuclease of toxin-antitoxin system
MAGERERIGERAIDAIDADEAEIVVSAVVVWEVAIKRRLGKLDAPADLLEQLERARVELLPITARHGNRAGALPMHHRDPFDRLLIAQAAVDELTLVSADTAMSSYEVDVIW